MTDDKYKKLKLEELLKVTEDVLQGNEEIISSCRKISSLRYDLGFEADPVFLPIVSIESESDHFILNDMPTRQVCEFKRFVDDVKSDVIECCRNIQHKFSGSNYTPPD